MLDAITTDNILHWQCLMLDRKGRVISCGKWKQVHIDETEYQLLYDEDGTGRGAVIALPKCTCGARYFLKADYDLEELYDSLLEETDPETGMVVQLLPLRYIRNLQAHWMLYERGKAEYAPVLPMPPIALLEHQSFASVKPATVMALWFGYLAARENSTALIEGGRA